MTDEAFRFLDLPQELQDKILQAYLIDFDGETLVLGNTSFTANCLALTEHAPGTRATILEFMRNKTVKDSFTGLVQNRHVGPQGTSLIEMQGIQSLHLSGSQFDPLRCYGINKQTIASRYCNLTDNDPWAKFVSAFPDLRSVYVEFDCGTRKATIGSFQNPDDAASSQIRKNLRCTSVNHMNVIGFGQLSKSLCERARDSRVTLQNFSRWYAISQNGGTIYHVSFFWD